MRDERHNKTVFQTFNNRISVLSSMKKHKFFRNVKQGLSRKRRVDLESESETGIVRIEKHQRVCMVWESEELKRVQEVK